MASSFLRPTGDKAQLVEWPPNRQAYGDDYDSDEDDPPFPPVEIYGHLKHGDIVHDPEGYRATTTFVVVASDADGGAVGIARTSDDTVSMISKQVSRFIEDPIDFYSEASRMYGIADHITFDVEAHQQVLSAQVGGRPVHPSRVVWWTEDGFCIEKPPSPQFRQGNANFDANTPNEYLGDATWLDQDPTAS